ncbi:MAG: hypothetical protein Q4G10_09145, partial [Bacteroidia bacterium]|nr:hypothetical protein [Bacteroidia bacterium]
MKKILTLAAAMLLVCSAANAQNVLGRLTERAKNAAENAVGNKIENAINGAIDKASSKKEKVDNRQTADAPEGVADASAENVKSDFVRGSVVLFQDDFKNEQIGEFPSKWDIISGNSEVSKVSGAMCFSLPPAQSSDGGNDAEIKPLMENPYNYLPEVFTLEFDWFVYQSEGKRNNFDIHLATKNDKELILFRFFPGDAAEGSCNVSYAKPGDDGRVNSDHTFKIKPNAWNHFAVSFNKRALKIYINDVRVLNAPNCAKPEYFYIWSNQRYLGNGVTVHEGTQFTNFILCDGAVALYEQKTTDLTAVEKSMQETGKFVTNNILFETGKATLKPESMS